MALRGNLFLGLILCALAHKALAQEFRMCGELMESGGPAPDDTYCYASPGECALSEENIGACAASGGTCFDDSFCCPTGWELCGAGFAGSFCYDSSFHTCCGIQSSPGGSGAVLCDSPTLANRANACAWLSFSPFCAPLTPPPVEEQEARCREQPFDPQTHVCIFGSTLCPRSAWLPCDTSCFHPNDYACEAELLFDQSRVESEGRSTYIGSNLGLCPLVATLRCGDAGCFSPEHYVCYTKNRADLQEDVLCPVDFPLLCGANACYNGAQYICADGQLRLAP